MWKTACTWFIKENTIRINIVENTNRKMWKQGAVAAECALFGPSYITAVWLSSKLAGVSDINYPHCWLTSTHLSVILKPVESSL